MLIRSISGVRGISDTDLKPETIKKYARALHQISPEGVLMAGCDSRPSGEGILNVMLEELIRLGRTVILCGVVPTPTVQFMVQNTEAVGGFIITASHNPVEWNGLKFVRDDSTFFHSDDCEKLFALVDNDLVLDKQDGDGMVWPEGNAIQKHVIACASISCIDLNRIQHRNFKVVIDAVNGGGAAALPAMLRLLGCDVIEINCEPNGNFTRGTEPLAENLSDLAQNVLIQGADAGFAVDPDADRLAVVNEKGKPLGEEYTLVLVADGYMEDVGKKETFVTNLSTSLALDKLAGKRDCKVVRSSVGEINVVNKMNEVNAKLGGEGNGGIILREAHLGRDSLVAVTMVLNRMSQTDKPLSVIHRGLPQFEIIKDKISLEGVDPEALVKKVITAFDDAEKNTLDGIKFTWDDHWVHLRKSNTEPIMRIYAEAPDRNRAGELINVIKNLI